MGNKLFLATTDKLIFITHPHHQRLPDIFHPPPSSRSEVPDFFQPTKWGKPLFIVGWLQNYLLHEMENISFVKFSLFSISGHICVIKRGLYIANITMLKISCTCKYEDSLFTIINLQL